MSVIQFFFNVTLLPENKHSIFFCYIFVSLFLKLRLSNTLNSLVKPDRNTLFWLSCLTLFGFGIAGLLGVHWFQDTPLRQVLLGGSIWYRQLLWGAVVGGAGALLVTLLVRLKPFQSIHQLFEDVLDIRGIDMHDVVFYSLCAAIGEELFFRAGLQMHLGNLLTSTIFVMLHGYLNPKNWQLSIFGFILIALSCAFGYLFTVQGFFAAVAAHFVYDVLVFSYLIFLTPKPQPN